MKLAFADRDEYYADPRFSDVPLPELLSDEYTAVRKLARWLASKPRKACMSRIPRGVRAAGKQLIDPEKASALRQPGNPRLYEPLLQEANAEVLPNSTSGITNQDTTTCVTADKWGETDLDFLSVLRGRSLADPKRITIRQHGRGDALVQHAGESSRAFWRDPVQPSPVP